MCTCPPPTGSTAAWPGTSRRPRPISASLGNYPFFTPERCLSELEALELPAEVMSAVLHDNAARILS